MAIFVGSTELRQVTESGTNTLEVRNSQLDLTRTVSFGGRNAGDQGSGRYYGFEDNQNRNYGSDISLSGGLNSAGTRYTAPLDGAYLFYVWLMFDNNGTYLNDDWQLHFNGSGSNGKHIRCYTSNDGDYHEKAASSAVIQMSAGDYVEVWLDDGRWYGNNNRYSRFIGIYLG